MLLADVETGELTTMLAAHEVRLGRLEEELKKMKDMQRALERLIDARIANVHSVHDQFKSGGKVG